MEILSLGFVSALAAIVVIDLVLAGDNAIVIALAARGLPPRLRRQAVIWGTVGAIAVRSAMTIAVVWLLKVPGLLLVGGVLLIWIAYRLLLPENGPDEHDNAVSAAGFWGALRTIVVADMVMGLDNVVAVAGAAHGSYLLVVLGLLISVPIVIWGSTIMLKWVERYPAIVYVGAGVLAWTAAKMIVSEPYVKETFALNGAATVLIFLAVIGGVLWAGFVRNHRRLESRISARLAALARRQGPEPGDVLANEGERAMLKVLVPVDGSRNAEHALRHVAKEYAGNSALEIHLLNVQAPLSRHIARFLGRRARDSFHRDEAEKALAPARALLEGLGLRYATHARLGSRSDAIVEEAQRLGCQRIVMATARKNSLTRMLEDSTTNKVLEHTTVPVEVIAGESVSRLERYGLPAGLGAAVALLFAAAAD